ncbi:MAG: ABC transporter ATP-binding protein [Acidobacteria bacterium]|nr:ABC transporter ATP-binding protein [Acidobacteriota bacterium]
MNKDSDKGLVLSKVSKTFTSGGKALKILDELDMYAPPGKMIALIGQSGVGKTTLLHIIGTIESFDSGNIFLDKQHLNRLSEKELNRFRNRNIGFVFQFFHLLPEFTALENAFMPLLIRGMDREEAEESAAELLKEMGLGERLWHYPSQLSGGEQQRVAAVRAIISSPKLLLADEPTGNLDPKTGSEILKMLKDLHALEEKITVLATHNAEIAGMCDRIYMLEKGKLTDITS